MFEVLATSRRRSILGFRLLLGFCKGFNLSRKAKPFGVIPNGFLLLFYCVSCFQAAFAMLKGSLKCLRYGNGKSGYGGDTPCSVSGCAKGWGSLHGEVGLRSSNPSLYLVFRLPHHAQ